MTLISSFDGVISRYETAHLSFTEQEALAESHWAMGQDARLREDLRFRPTPWSRWVPSTCLLVNDRLFEKLTQRDRSEVDLVDALSRLEKETNRRVFFCPGDNRFVLRDGLLRLSAKPQRSRFELVEATQLEQFTTHLPVYSLKAVAASAPAGEWGTSASGQVIEPLGWLPVNLPGITLKPELFVAQIVGHSMDDGRRDTRDGAWGIFSLGPVDLDREPIALVQGAFGDPDTPTFALKRLKPERAPDGGLQSLRLVSENPDKERYPDIVLGEHEAADVRVVARYLRALPQPPRRRHLKGSDVQRRIERHMTSMITRFFAEPRSADESDARVDAGWKAILRLTIEPPFQLIIETHPLQGLPGFVRQLTIHNAEGGTSDHLASNFRHLLRRSPVQPAGGTYQFSAPGFEDEPEISTMLENLSVPGLDPRLPTLFRPHADGLATRLAENRVVAGDLIVIPSAALDLFSQAGPEEAFPLGNWWLWQPADPAGGSRAQLEALGLKTKPAGVTVTWAGTIPRRYLLGSNGQAYPCFHPDDDVIVHLSGVAVSPEHPASVYVQGPEGLVSFELPPGDNVSLGLTELAEGPYVLRVLSSRGDLPPTHAFFSVSREVRQPVKARVSMMLGEEQFLVEGEHEREVGSMLADEGLSLETPPFWPVQAVIETPLRKLERRMQASPLGLIAEPEWESLVHDELADSLAGHLQLDFGVLGRLTLRHRPELGIERVQETLRKAGQLALAGKYMYGASRESTRDWLFPILVGMGWKATAFQDAPPWPGVLLALCIQPLRRDSAGDNLLLAMAPGHDLEGPEFRQFVRGLAKESSFQTVLATDGDHWRQYLPKPLPPITLDQLAGEATQELSYLLESYWTEDLV